MAPGTCMPQHPRTHLYAIGITRSGKPIWPVMGGEDSADAAAQAEAAAKANADKAAETTGFPASTPLEQMTSDQREAYWKHQARKHEGRVKAFGDLTPEKLTELQEKARRNDELELELGSTADKAAAKAAQDAQDKTRGEFQPQLIQARLDAAAARAGVTEDDLTAALEFVDTAKFLGADGAVDTDKVKAFIATIKPAISASAGGFGRTGPSSSGLGHHQAAAGKPGDSARAALAKRGIKID